MTLGLTSPSDPTLIGRFTRWSIVSRRSSADSLLWYVLRAITVEGHKHMPYRCVWGPDRWQPSSRSHWLRRWGSSRCEDACHPKPLEHHRSHL